MLIYLLKILPARAFGETIDFLEEVGEEGAGYELSVGNVHLITARIINASLTLLGAIFLILILYGGFRYMTAGGDSEKVKDAVKTIRNSAIGLIIVLAAFAIARFVLNALVRATVESAGGG